MGKRGFLLAALLLALCACGAPGAAGESGEGAVPSWQEQYELGCRYLFDEDYEQAVLAFTAAIEIDTKRPQAYGGAGEAYMGLGQSDQAVQVLNDALEHAEADASVYQGLADVYITLGDYEAAADILRRGIEATEDQSLQNVLASLDSHLSGEQVDYTVSNANVTFRALDSRRGQASLTLDNLPLTTTVWPMSGPDDNVVDNVLTFSFSDGTMTFTLWVDTRRVEGGAYEIRYPQDEAVTAWFMVYVQGPGQSMYWTWLEDCAVVRRGNTLTWNFMVPEWGFSLDKVEYVGYSLYLNQFVQDEESYGGSGVYRLEGGAMVPVDGVSRIEDLGYFITEEQLDAFESSNAEE